MSTTKFNDVVANIAVSDIRQFDAEASKIDGIIKLTLGEPDFNTPEHIKTAAIEAIKQNHSHYTPNAGIMPLRQAVADYYNEKFNLNYTANQTIVCIGATEAIAASMQTFLNPGDVVLVPTPVFPIYMTDAQLNHAEFRTVDTAKDGFVLTAERLEQILAQDVERKIKLVVLNYPTNPTGVTYTKDQLKTLAAVLKKYGVWALCDEVYAELTYNHPHVSLAEFLPEQTIVVYGLSKSHAMTGWRVGFILAPQAFVDQAVKAHQYMITSTPAFIQYASLEAMENGKDDAAKMLVEYKKRRDFMIKELTEAGFEVASPDGAFYLFLKIPAHCKQDSWDFVKDLAKKARVALIPGSSFGPGGNGYARLSYAASMDDLSKAAQRIKEYVAKEGK